MCLVQWALIQQLTDSFLWDGRYHFGLHLSLFDQLKTAFSRDLFLFFSKIIFFLLSCIIHEQITQHLILRIIGHEDVGETFLVSFKDAYCFWLRV